MPELKCAQSDAYFVLRDGALGIFLAAHTFPRSRETRAPEVADLKRHRAELDPKFHFLADAPERDPEGNPFVIRFSRKTREHFLAALREGEPTGWTAQFIDGKWEVRQTADRPKAPAGKARLAGAKRPKR